MANFESFSRALLPLKPDPHVTIQKRGTISMNKPAYLAIGSPAAVELLYDRNAKIIGIRGTDPAVDHAYDVRRSARSPNGPWVVSAMAFTRYYDIDTSTTWRWAAYLEAGVLCVDLNQQPTPVTSNRSRGTQGR